MHTKISSVINGHFVQGETSEYNIQTESVYRLYRHVSPEQQFPNAVRNQWQTSVSWHEVLWLCMYFCFEYCLLLSSGKVQTQMNV